MSRSLLQRLAFWQPAPEPVRKPSTIRYAKWKIGDTIKVLKVTRMFANFYDVTGKVVAIDEFNGVLYYSLSIDEENSQYSPMVISVTEDDAARVPSGGFAI